MPKKRPLLVTCNDLSAASPPSGALRRSSKVSGRCWSKARSSSWPRIIQCITVSDGLCIHVHTIDFRYWCYLMFIDVDYFTVILVVATNVLCCPFSLACIVTYEWCSLIPKRNKWWLRRPVFDSTEDPSTSSTGGSRWNKWNRAAQG
jgi:hypothetical protein